MSFYYEKNQHQMIVSLIAAIGPNGEIGSNGLIPWKSKEDMKYFKNLTIGCPVIMGRITWDSIGKPLIGRLNIVLTKNEELIGLSSNSVNGPIFIHDLTAALTMLSENEIDECFIIGGAKVYDEALSLDLVDRMFINKIKLQVQGNPDAYFPFIEETMWNIEKSNIEYNDFDAYLYERKKEQEILP